MSNSAKLLASAAAPLMLSPRSCDPKEDACEPAAPAVSRSNRPARCPRDVIVIGSGFGATVAVANLLSRKPDLNILVVERGLWWLSPARPKPDYLAANQSERVQYYTRPDHAHGARYMLSILSLNGARPRSNADPLYRLHTFGDMNVLTATGSASRRGHPRPYPSTSTTSRTRT